MSEYIQVTTTIDSAEKAQALAATLVERRLAACCQIVGPISSTYRWQGKVESSQEWQIVSKTSRKLWPAIEQAIRELHSYETPEIIAIDIVSGSNAYLNWLQQQLG